MYSKYDQEEFEGIGDMDKPGHSMKDPLIIHKVRPEGVLSFAASTCCRLVLCDQH